jgi:CHAD domain-containing protein
VHRERESRAFRLKRGEAVAEGMRRIAAGRAESALERLRGIDPDDPDFADSVHGARKDLKKLRTVVRLLGEQLGEQAAAEGERYRDAGRALSGSRDAQVKLETLEALGEADAALSAEALTAWREALRRERDRSLEEFDQMAAFESIELIEAGRDRIGAWDLDLDSRQLIGGGVRRVYARGREAMRRAEAAPSEEGFHRWRKRAKDLWYALRILEGAWPEVLGATAEQAHALGDRLGAHHDLAILREDLAARPLPAERSGGLAAAIAARQQELAEVALDLGHRLYAEKPKAFGARLCGCWRAWHADS